MNTQNASKQAAAGLAPELQKETVSISNVRKAWRVPRIVEKASLIDLTHDQHLTFGAS